ncbi:MAG TPA: SpoIIE family protein phosphatase [Skermanella sp.]|jgi:phosphoserine phosphatase RsbX|nr:SpoIIE family protein phosphatase [Skermanella sp.]
MAMNIGLARRSANAADVCGDNAGAWTAQATEVLAIADGLGHGRDAAVAASAALDIVASWSGLDALDLFKRMNETLRATRGAAVSVATIDWAASRVSYTAVGNTRAAVFGERTQRLDGYAGIVGGGYRRLQSVSATFTRGDVLALWTDGVDEGLSIRSADRGAGSLDDMAAGLLARFAKGNDDACVIVASLALT